MRAAAQLCEILPEEILTVGAEAAFDAEQLAIPLLWVELRRLEAVSVQGCVAGAGGTCAIFRGVQQLRAKSAAAKLLVDEQELDFERFECGAGDDAGDYLAIVFNMEAEIMRVPPEPVVVRAQLGVDQLLVGVSALVKDEFGGILCGVFCTAICIVICVVQAMSFLRGVF